MGKLIAFPKKSPIKAHREKVSGIELLRQIGPPPKYDEARKRMVETTGVDFIAILFGDEEEKRKYEMIKAQHRARAELED